MSECVVRMEMPKRCMDCPLHEFGGICRLSCDFKQIDVMVIDKGRPENCPIICQLPEGHGELIERQPIIQFIEDGLNRGEYGHDQIEVMTEVFVAETIVPAEAERSE